jgi:membrane protein implicated in regulation of membrane protease activity
MNAWWSSLTVLEQMLCYVAIPATLLMVLQTLLLLFGIHSPGDVDAGGGADAHFDGHLDWGAGHDQAWEDNSGDHDTADHTGNGLFAGLKLFTLRGVIAFLAIFGWGALWLLQVGLHPIFALFLGIAMGFWSMVLIALFLRVAMKLEYDGTMDLRNALGVSGSVYLTVPAERGGTGKISVMIQEQITEVEAVTDDHSPLPTGEEITVVGISGKSILVVTKK